jgi:hypothetical protein
VQIDETQKIAKKLLTSKQGYAIMQSQARENSLPSTPKKNKKKVLTSKTRCGKLKTIQEGTQKQSIKRK